MPVGIENQAYGLLAGGISAVAVSISLQAGHGARFGAFPAGTWKTARLIKTDGSIELVKITARSTDTLTVERAQQGTTGLTFSINDRIEIVPDKGTMAEFVQLGLYGQSLAAAGTASAMTATLATGGSAASLFDGFQITVAAVGANTIAAPTFNLTLGTATGAKIIVRPDGGALSVGDIPAAGFRMQLLYNLALDRWVLTNPAALLTGEAARAPHWSMNAVINGDMRFAQRGVVNDTSVGNAFSGYTLDRWQANRAGDVAGLNVYQSSDSDVPLGNQFALIMQRVLGNASAATCSLYYSATLEDTAWLRGQIVALTFRAKCGANFSAAGGALSVGLSTTATHSGTDARVYNFVAPVAVINSAAALTTSWQTFTFFGTIPNDTKQFGLQLQWNPSGAAGADDTARVTRVRVVPAIVRAGAAVAAPDVPPAPFDLERMRCERYFERLTAAEVAAIASAAGYIANGIGFQLPVPYRERKRVTPSVNIASAVYTLSNVAAPTLQASSAAGFLLQFVGAAPGGFSATFSSGHIDAYAEV